MLSAMPASLLNNSVFKNRSAMYNKKISGLILAGGENRRFPIPKGFIKINGSLVIERSLSLLKKVFDEVSISANKPEPYFYLGVPLIGDVLFSKGPMSGIYSGLANTSTDSIFTIACDMPFVKMEVISYICERHKDISDDIDATIPIYNGQPQPLLGIYRKTILSYIDDLILNEKTSMRHLLTEINTNFIKESDIMVIDQEGESFVNINTMEDYEKVVNSDQRTAFS